MHLENPHMRGVTVGLHHCAAQTPLDSSIRLLSVDTKLLYFIIFPYILALSNYKTQKGKENPLRLD